MTTELDTTTAMSDRETLLREATPRPWRFEDTSDGWDGTTQHLVAGSAIGYSVVLHGWGYDAFGIEVSEADAALIVAAVNDYERLLRVEAAAREAADGWDAYIEASAGRGHAGKHEPEPALDGDCGPCAGARYGTEVEMGEYVMPRLRAALTEPQP